MRLNMSYQFKLLCTLSLFSLFLVACNETEPKKTNEQNTTAIKASPAAPKNTNDGHAGHNHGETAAPIKDGAVTSGDYETFDKPYATDNSEQVIVYEFFGYPCPHCFSFQPYMDNWLEDKPDYVKLVRVPLNFQQGWDILQQAYFTSEVMGISEKSHLKLFSAIHKENKRFRSIEDIAQWFEDELDVNKDEFLGTANSFILNSKQRQADNMGFKMQVTSTPTVIVNGKFKPSKKIRDRESIMKVLDYLVEKEAKKMGLKQ